MGLADAGGDVADVRPRQFPSARHGLRQVRSCSTLPTGAPIWNSENRTFRPSHSGLQHMGPTR